MSFFNHFISLQFNFFNFFYCFYCQSFTTFI
nr:MAG TPA: hypothetical protein [Caudoviricetes sp.]